MRFIYRLQQMPDNKYSSMRCYPQTKYRSASKRSSSAWWSTIHRSCIQTASLQGMLNHIRKRYGTNKFLKYHYFFVQADFDTNFIDRNAFITGVSKYMEEATRHADFVSYFDIFFVMIWSPCLFSLFCNIYFTNTSAKHASGGTGSRRESLHVEMLFQSCSHGQSKSIQTSDFCLRINFRRILLLLKFARAVMFYLG